MDWIKESLESHKKEIITKLEDPTSFIFDCESLPLDELKKFCDNFFNNFDDNIFICDNIHNGWGSCHWSTRLLNTFDDILNLIGERVKNKKQLNLTILEIRDSKYNISFYERDI